MKPGVAEGLIALRNFGGVRAVARGFAPTTCRLAVMPRLLHLLRLFRSPRLRALNFLHDFE